MHSRAIIDLVKEKSLNGLFYAIVEQKLHLPGGTVQYIVKMSLKKLKKPLSCSSKLSRLDNSSFKIHIATIKKTRNNVTARKLLNNRHCHFFIRTMHCVNTGIVYGVCKVRKTIVLKPE